MEVSALLDRAIIDHASPTLARLKLGNLFTYGMDGSFMAQFEALADRLGQRGVTLTILRVNRGVALIYVYREDQLAAALRDEATGAFLRRSGYTRLDVPGALDTLRDRLRSSEGFPHEIGVFLGYPLEDVLGFIRNGGRNCLSCGCWKVYSNECEALRTFARYDKCKAVYQRLFASGCPLTRLTVAAAGRWRSTS